MAKIFRKTHNPYALCAITHSLTLTWELEVLTKVMGGWGGAKRFHTLKAGAQQVLACLAGEGGGGHNKFWTCNFPFCSSPLSP